MRSTRLLAVLVALAFLLSLGVVPIWAQSPALRWWPPLGGPAPVGGAAQPASRATTSGLGRGFSFQGQLLDNGGVPVNDTCDFGFSLWDHPYDANDMKGLPPYPGQLGQSVFMRLAVQGGRFTASDLDFLVNAFTGEPRYLQVVVLCSPSPQWTMLLPRQLVQPAPYALFSVSTGSLQGNPVVSTMPAAGQVLKWNGSQWGPEVDANSVYTPGFGISLAANLISVNLLEVQRRVGNTCPPGEAIQKINVDGSVICEAVILAASGVISETDGRYWRLGGNAGAPLTSTLGTLDGLTVTLVVNGTPALRLSPGSGTPNIVAGHANNSLGLNLKGVVIAGGGSGSGFNYINGDFGAVAGGEQNRVLLGDHGTVGGGYNNQIAASYGVIAGGQGNTVPAQWGAVVGGLTNNAKGMYSLVGGGFNNNANGYYSVVGGGSSNSAGGAYAVVPGGLQNTANADYSFAGGYLAQVITGHSGSFVWADTNGGSPTTFASTGRDQFLVRALGGVTLTTGSGVGGIRLTSAMTAPLYNNYTIWHSGDDGSGSGLDADLLDGIQGTAYVTKTLADSLYVYHNGSGLDLSSNTFSVDLTEIQKRVTSNCAIGAAIRQVNEDGSVVCGAAVSSIAASTGIIAAGSTTVTLSLDTAYTDGRYWKMGGNPDAGSSGDYLGTTNETTLTLGVNGVAALRLAPTSGTPNVLGGYSGNSAASGVVGAAVAGGGAVTGVNTVLANYGTVGGGLGNTAGGAYSAVPGGSGNVAGGDYSLAAGRLAKANQSGSFVWGDSTDAQVTSGGPNQFVVRANGGIWFGAGVSDVTATIESGVFISTSTGAYLSSGGSWTNSSDRAIKTGFGAVDGQQVLARLADMPIETWTYTADAASGRHLGPVAQDFYAAFGLGADDRHISTVDADGVSLAVAKALNETSQKQAAQIAALQSQLGDQTRALKALEQRLATLEGGRGGDPTGGGTLTLGIFLGGLGTVACVGCSFAAVRLYRRRDARARQQGVS